MLSLSESQNYLTRFDVEILSVLEKILRNLLTIIAYKGIDAAVGLRGIV